MALTFVCAWASTLLVDWAWDGVRGVFPTRLLAESAHYWLTMGWPPLLAVLVVRRWIEPPEPLDFGLASSGRGILVLGGLAAASVAALAMMITRLGEALRLAPAGAAPLVDSPVPSGPSVETIAMLGIAFVMTVVLLWGQAFIEELGWRGYLLPRMMQSLGPWPGLVVHGLVWGMWYAPVVALAAGDLGSTPVRGVTFVVTGTLLGTLLGWMRLAWSLSLAVVFNVVLTVAAGLPFILRGVDVGSRGAAYGPVGWIPLLVVTGILFIAPTRRAVRTPPAVATHPRGPTTGRRLVGVGALRNGNHAR